ncbi:MAG: hypothetical protein S4CHLAM102_08540 [Chlamydiia bacterium]|nr:hypothetical protein [Chlamydiia bacterium]
MVLAVQYAPNTLGGLPGDLQEKIVDEIAPHIQFFMLARVSRQFQMHVKGSAIGWTRILTAFSANHNGNRKREDALSLGHTTGIFKLYQKIPRLRLALPNLHESLRQFYTVGFRLAEPCTDEDFNETQSHLADATMCFFKQLASLEFKLSSLSNEILPLPFFTRSLARLISTAPIAEKRKYTPAYLVLRDLANDLAHYQLGEKAKHSINSPYRRVVRCLNQLSYPPPPLHPDSLSDLLLCTDQKDEVRGHQILSCTPDQKLDRIADPLTQIPSPYRLESDAIASSPLRNYTFFHLALAANNAQAVDTFLSNEAFRVRLKESDPTPLCVIGTVVHAAVKSNSPAMLARLKAVDENWFNNLLLYRSSSNQTPFVMAIAQGSLEMAQTLYMLLSDKGKSSEVHRVVKVGSVPQTLIDYALKSQSLQMVQWVVSLYDPITLQMIVKSSPTTLCSLWTAPFPILNFLMQHIGWHYAYPIPYDKIPIIVHIFRARSLHPHITNKTDRQFAKELAETLRANALPINYEESIDGRPLLLHLQEAQWTLGFELIIEQLDPALVHRLLNLCPPAKRAKQNPPSDGRSAPIPFGDR